MMRYYHFLITLIILLIKFVSVDGFSANSTFKQSYLDQSKQVYYATAYYYHQNKIPSFRQPIDTNALHLFSQYYRVFVDGDVIMRFDHYENNHRTTRNLVFRDFVLSERYRNNKLIEYRRLFYSQENKLKVEEIYRGGFLESYYHYFYRLNGELQCIETVRHHQLKSESCVLKPDPDSGEQFLDPFISRHQKLNPGKLNLPIDPSELTERKKMKIHFFNSQRLKQSIQLDQRDQVKYPQSLNKQQHPHSVKSIYMFYQFDKKILSTQVEITKSFKGKIRLAGITVEAFSEDNRLIKQFETQRIVTTDNFSKPVEFELKIDAQKEILRQISFVKIYINFQLNKDKPIIILGPFSIPISNWFVEPIAKEQDVDALDKK